MYYNINKLLNGAKKYNIKIAERGFGQTYYLRQKIEEMKKQLDLDNECEIALNSKIEELKKYEEGYKLLSYSLDNYISKDKIKAKIEDILNSENSEAIEKLIEWQSLLEKE